MNQYPKTDEPMIISLKRFVVEIIGAANAGDQQGIQKAIRYVHNKLATGGLPRSFFVKFGKDLYVNVSKFKDWIEQGGNISD